MRDREIKWRYECAWCDGETSVGLKIDNPPLLMTDTCHCGKVNILGIVLEPVVESITRGRDEERS